MSDDAADQVRDLYLAILRGWNAADAAAFAAPFADDGEVIGFDGSEVRGRETIEAGMARIFADHATGRYVGLVRGVTSLSPDVALLRAVSGVVPAGADEINPALNAIQSLLAIRVGDTWRVRLYHNTPAAWHGRPDLVQTVTDELRRELAQQR
jgi:uncharacterized protein (TIGR02246 family)